MRLAGDCSGPEPCPWDDDYHDALDYDPCNRWLAERVGFWPIRGPAAVAFRVVRPGG